MVLKIFAYLRKNKSRLYINKEFMLLQYINLLLNTDI